MDPPPVQNAIIKTMTEQQEFIFSTLSTVETASEEPPPKKSKYVRVSSARNAPSRFILSFGKYLNSSYSPKFNHFDPSMNYCSTHCVLCHKELIKREDLSPEEARFRVELRQICVQSLNPTLFLDYRKGDWLIGKGPEEIEVEARDHFPFCEGPCLQPALELMQLHSQFLEALGALNKARRGFTRRVAESYFTTQSDKIEFQCGGVGVDEVLDYWCKGVGVDSLEGGGGGGLGDGIQVKVEQDDDNVVDGEDGESLEFNEKMEDELKELIITPDYLKDVDLNPFVKLERLEDEDACDIVIASTLHPAPMDDYCGDSNSYDFDPSTSNENNVRRRRSARKRVPTAKIADEIVDDDVIYSEEDNEEDASYSCDVPDSEPESSSAEDLEDQSNDEIFDPNKIKKRKYVRKKTLKPKAPPKPKVPKKVKEPPKPKIPRPPVDPNAPKKKRIRIKHPRAPCSVCGIPIDRTYMRVHMRIHTNEKPYACNLCPSTFYKKSNLVQHVATRHNDEKSHVCKYCDFRVGSKTTLSSHLATIHRVFRPDANFECQLCGYRFLYEVNLNSHLASVHKDGGGVAEKQTPYCSMCGLNFQTVAELEEHITVEAHLKALSHLNDRRQQGKLGGSNRRARSMEVRPPSSNGQEPKRPGRPKEPNVGNNTEGDAVSSQTYICSECGKVFSTLKRVHQHEKMVHNPQNLSCNVCGRQFSNMMYLRKHSVLHKPEKLFVCEFCGKGYNFASSMKSHLASHTGNYAHMCHYCPVGFNGLNQLRKHLCITHPDEHCKDKPWICTRGDCYYTFEDEATLKRHEEAEKHEENLKCKICQRWFRTRKHLRRHVVIHTGEKPHQCKICLKSFNNPSNLVIHNFQHTGQRPFKCTCGEGFMRKKALANHQSKGCSNEDSAEVQTLSRSNRVDLAAYQHQQPHSTNTATASSSTTNHVRTNSSQFTTVDLNAIMDTVSNDESYEDESESDGEWK